ncbi:hypothetical protein BK744_03380 [Bacillus thuringiensis serovar zhaodongensis]|uniref:hypothetical protein n=1 Tax=Bacillus thuringiensis TaxID=1428 RepID=UPI000A373F19|nr:hypothetical protein [Bacillus thuringiensis]OUB79326.1 hypothetical protein BK744_03380 [Bacillus thuringiensis serovar zhaodongensis]
MMSIGKILSNPESGWIRKNCQPANIETFFKGVNLNGSKGWFAVGSDENAETGNAWYATSEVPSSVLSFTFFGSGFRIITGHDEVPKSSFLLVTVDGSSRTVNLSAHTSKFTVVYEDLNLQNKEHTVTIRATGSNTGRFTFLYAIDYLNLELEKKSKVSLYEKESGKIFVNDFDTINPKWLMSPSNAFNNAVKKGFLRMNHSADKDVMLLIDKPQSNFAIQVIADYAPTKEGDEGGLLIYQNEKNKVEFLESYSANGSQSNKEWMAICKEDQWDFYTKTDTFFDYADNDSLAAKRIGVVLKRGTAEGFVPLDINKIIMTTSNMLRLRQLYENYKVVLKDTADNILSTNIVAAAHTGIDILLPSLEFEGIVEIYDEENELIAKKQATFYGGDMYCMGSSLQIKMNSEELNTTDPTNLGYMVNNERIVKMTIVNDNIGAATNIKLSIQQYMEKVGYTWALISLDGTSYLNEIQIDSVAAQSTRDFWVKVVKDTNFLAFEPIYFNIHLKHN